VAVHPYRLYHDFTVKPLRHSTRRPEWKLSMSRTLYCLNVACQQPFQSEAGFWPDICPFCFRPARWTTEKPGQYSKRDIAFLRSIRISPHEEETV